MKKLPQKRLIIGSIVAVLLLGAAYYHWGLDSFQSNEPVVAAREAVKNPGLDLSFTYVAGEDGFRLATPTSTENGLLASYLLVPQDDFATYAASEGGEAPPLIAVLVYPLENEVVASGTERVERITRLQNWAVDNDVLTSFTKAIAPPEIVEIDGVKAFHYRADGLYQQEIYLASYKGRVYLFATQFNEEADLTYTSFGEIMSSVSFD